MRITALCLIASCLAVSCLAMAACGSTPDAEPPPEEPTFPDGWRVIDVTRPLDRDAPYLPHPEAFPFERVDLAPASPSGRRSAAYSALEHMGTHVEAPAAYVRDASDVMSIGGSALLLPLTILDAPPSAPGSPGPALGTAALRAQEVMHGEIPVGSLVLLRTGQGALSSRELGAAGRAPAGGFAFPGLSAEAVWFLVAERGAAAVGTDALALDAGSEVDEAPAARAAADAQVWTLVGTADLTRLPHRGAYVVVGLLPLAGGGSAPARVLALVPPPPPPPPPVEE